MTQTAEINVTGQGGASAMPDGMQIDLKVVSRKSDYPQTLDDLHTRVAAIVDAVKRAGVEETVITKSYEIEEVWSHQFDEEKREFQGYKAVQKMSVTIALNNSQLGRAIKELAASGGAPGVSIVFVIRDEGGLERQARIAAVNKAKESASDIAQAAGLQLTAVKSITYSEARSGPTGDLRLDSLIQCEINPVASVSPDVISHYETVHIVWLAIPILKA